MDANTFPHPEFSTIDFEAFAASDTRVCLLIDADGIVIAVNPLSKRALPEIIPGSDLLNYIADPAAFRHYLHRCSKTRGPLPGALKLNNDNRDPNWNCQGGLATWTPDRKAIIILRLQTAELGKSAFASLNAKIESLNAEMNWRERADRDKGYLAAIVSSSSDAIYSKNLSNIITSWNRGAESLFGYSANEIVGHSALKLIPLGQRDEETKLIARIKAGKTIEPTETIRQAKDGRLLDVSVTISPIQDRSGAVIGMSKIVRDITARKRAEETIRAARDTFRKLVDHSPFGIFAINSNFQIVQVSTGAQPAFANVRPLIGRDLAEALNLMWPEPAASEFIGHFKETLATGKPYRQPSLVETRLDTNEVESYDWMIERLVLPDGKYGVVCHFYDLSERQQYEEAIRESERKFRGTFNDVSVGIAHIGADGRWLEVNNRLCELFGYTRKELEARTLRSLIHPDDLDVHDKQERQLLAGNITDIQFENRYLNKRGDILWMNVSAGLQRDAADQPDFMIYVMQDISAPKASQEHQKLLMRELAHRSKNQLAVVQAIAGQTARAAYSMEHFRTVFSQRLNGLSVSVDLLVKGKWISVPLNQLIQSQLAAFVGNKSRLKCGGPNVSVGAKAAETIGLALHELATNCVKYGAWSSPDGAVSMTWRMKTDGAHPSVLQLSWVEIGGPPVEMPEHKGFGHVIIEQMIASELNAKVELSYPAKGLTWGLSIPAEHIVI